EKFLGLRELERALALGGDVAQREEDRALFVHDGAVGEGEDADLAVLAADAQIDAARILLLAEAIADALGARLIFVGDQLLELAPLHLVEAVPGERFGARVGEEEAPF